MDDLSGRVAVVTGAGSGIGRAIALDLAGAGMHVVVADIDHDSASAVAAEVEAGGARAVAVRTDVADHDSVLALAAASIEAFGRVHVVVNNAGVLLLLPIREAVVEDWRWIYGVNVMGVVHGIHSFLPHLLEHGEPAHIVNTSSIAAIGGQGIYGSSKAAILGITASLHEELAGTNIGVSCLLPGMVATRIVNAQRNRPADLGRMADQPLAVMEGQYGVDPSHCAVRVREAILGDELIVFAGIPTGHETGLLDGARKQADDLLAAIPRGVVDEAP